MDILSEHELAQPAVVKIITYMEERLDKHRKGNDHINACPLLRGRIAELKSLQKNLKLTGAK
ncbi:MAG: hypothetical protein COA78_12125 [Blastopirellula sp.]|nr:MAG: hypothetical protein COA78_12125 [Blastopirellula sp.]